MVQTPQINFASLILSIRHDGYANVMKLKKNEGALVLANLWGHSSTTVQKWTDSTPNYD